MTQQTNALYERVAFSEVKCNKSATAKKPLGEWEKAALLFFASLLSWGQLLKERICSSRSKFFPYRVDPMAKSYLIQRNKQEIYVPIFAEKRQATFIRGGTFKMINMVC